MPAAGFGARSQGAALTVRQGHCQSPARAAEGWRRQCGTAPSLGTPAAPSSSGFCNRATKDWRKLGNLRPRSCRQQDGNVLPSWEGCPLQHSLVICPQSLPAVQDKACSRCRGSSMVRQTGCKAPHVPRGFSLLSPGIGLLAKCCGSKSPTLNPGGLEAHEHLF